MPQHSLENIERKVRMNATVTPPEMLLVIKGLMSKMDSLGEKLSGLEATTNTRQRSSDLSKD
jgi:hypothetical protein